MVAALADGAECWNWVRPALTDERVLKIEAGRHPVVGVAAAFAGVSGGYSANLVLGTIDPLLSGLTQEAARIVDPIGPRRAR